MRTLLTAVVAPLLLGTGAGCYFDLGDDRYHQDRSAYDRGPVDRFIAPLGDEATDLAVRGVPGDDVDVRARLGSDDRDDLDRSDIWLDHRGGAVELVFRPHDGDVHLDYADASVSRDADLDLVTGSGDIQVDGMRSWVRAEAGSGDLDVYTTGAVDLTTGSGDVRAGGGTGSVYTGSGDVGFELIPDASGTLDVRTGSGDVNVRLPSGLGVNVDASTGSGDIVIDAGGVHLSRDGSAHVTLDGGGEVTVRIHAGSGDVQVTDR